MRPTATALCCACLVVATTACPQSPDFDAEPAAPAATGTSAAPAASGTPLVSGKVVTIPPVYRGLELGMSVAEAQAIHPGMPEEDTIKDPDHPDVYFVAAFDEASQKLTRFYFSLPSASAKETVMAQWGEGLVTQELGSEMHMWFNPAGGLRATLKDGFGEDCDLEFTSYIPYATLLGAQGKSLAFQNAGPLLGMSADEVREKYADVLVEKSQQDAEDDRKKLEALVGKKVQSLGAPRPSMHLEFPPTEYEQYWTRVNLTLAPTAGAKDQVDRVQRIWFTLPWELNPAAKGEMMALFKAKWGEPKREQDLGESLWVFAGGETTPRIELKDNAITPGWDLAVEARHEH